MQIHSKVTGTRGFVRTYDEALRLRDMITPHAQERARILAFWNTHGDAATQEAFTVSRPTLFRWQKVLEDGGGKLEALTPKSTAPKRKRERVIPKEVQNLILAERARERIGKEKLAVLLKGDGIATLSPSTVGRMLADMKQRGLLPLRTKLSFSGKTGRFIEKKPHTLQEEIAEQGA